MRWRAGYRLGRNQLRLRRNGRHSWRDSSRNEANWLVGRHRETDLKSRVARLGTNLNAAAMLSYDPLNRIQSQPSSLAHSFRCEKRLEDARFHLRRNARTIITNLHHDT